MSVVGGQGMVRVVSWVSGDIILWEVMLKVRGGIFLEGP